MTKILFLCRQSEDSTSGSYGYFRKFSGLFNSARFVNDMLRDNDIDSHIAIAKDNNCIDRLVTEYKPEICVIEAYWVVPEKFEILHKLHPNITWIIRIHSEVPFWATEGIAMDWTLRYLDYDNVILAPNAKRLHEDLKTVLSVKYSKEEIKDKVIYLPNYYPAEDKGFITHKREDNILNVGCFGAVRPLKNHLIQAIAAIDYCNRNNLELQFNINGNRIEGGGDPVLKNIRSLFEHSKKHKLIEHAWQPHSDFLQLISQMDIGLQVSFTESFNIVAADFITVGVPMVTSSEISWVSKIFHADPTNSRDITDIMGRALMLGKIGVSYNRHLLHEFSNTSKNIWINYLS